jgi:stalled ribosome rescue protein Dom34
MHIAFLKELTMSAFIVWIDLKEAKIFQCSPGKVEQKHLHANYADHHTHQFDQLDRNRIENRFFAQVGSELTGAARILILGPGVEKKHFQSYLVEHLPALAKNVTGCETVDHPTDPQIAAFARKMALDDAT